MPLIASLLVLLILGSAAQAQDPVRRGRALVGKFCSSCHAVARFGRGPKPSAPPFRTLGRNFDLDQLPRWLERGIASNHPAMPEFKFSTDDALAVRAYLRTIQR